MEKKHLLQEFTDYWDTVIGIWLNKYRPHNSIEIDAKRPINSPKECYYKDNNLNVCIEQDQQWWFEDQNPLNEILCPIHMPEPYWGNPEKCSIVIVNYNPAGGTDMNVHTYRGEGKSFPNNTMISYVNDKSYSNLVKDFPILNSSYELGKDELFWLRSYGGRQWWREKIEWMTHLVRPDNPSKEWPEKVHRPFAIELCGWHSAKWTNKMKAIYNCNNLKNSIRQWFVFPLLQSIENSTSKMAVCIGAQFEPSILEKFFDKDTFHDITKEVKKSIPKNNDKKTYNYLLDNEEPVNCIRVTINNNKKITKRYYRVYNVVYGNRNHIILNTYAPGSNHHPAKHFWPFEKTLINVIKNIFPANI